MLKCVNPEPAAMGQAGPLQEEEPAMSMTVGATKNRGSEMNVTPLIDVLLVLLIIFMVLPHHRGEKAEIPRTNTLFRQPDNIVIHLRDAGSGRPPALIINQEQVGAEAFETRLTKIFQARSEKTAFLKSDPAIDFQYVAEVMDAARRAGADRVGLLDTSN